MSGLFFRRHEVWLPTWRTLLPAIILLGALSVLGVRALPGFLAPDAPVRGADGRGARTLLVEGWLDPDEFAQAVAAYRRGHYERIVTSGGPIEPWPDAGGWRDFASRAAGTLRAQGLAGVPIVSVPAPEADRDRTWRSALAVREWAERSGTPLGSIDVFTSGVHARRSQLATRLAMGRNTEVGVIAAHRSGYDAGRWWRSSESAKATIGEAFSWGWTVCCFWPGDPASMPPRSPSMPPQPRSP